MCCVCGGGGLGRHQALRTFLSLRNIVDFVKYKFVRQKHSLFYYLLRFLDIFKAGIFIKNNGTGGMGVGSSLDTQWEV